MRGRLSQRLNRLEFVVHVDGPSVFSHCGEQAVINDASRVRPFRIEWAPSESGFGRLFLIVGNLSRSQCGVHTNNNRSLQGNVKDSTQCRSPPRSTGVAFECIGMQGLKRPDEGTLLKQGAAARDDQVRREPTEAVSMPSRARPPRTRVCLPAIIAPRESDRPRSSSRVWHTPPSCGSRP